MLTLQVIGAIGVSMIFLGLLIWLPMPVIAIIGGAIFLSHNIFDYITTKGLFIKILFTSPGFSPESVIQLNQSHYIMDAYAILPWTGVMLMGFVFGQLFQKGFDLAKRQQIILQISSMLFIAFLVLRYFNIYGDPAP